MALHEKYFSKHWEEVAKKKNPTTFKLLLKPESVTQGADQAEAVRSYLKRTGVKSLETGPGYVSASNILCD